MQVIDGLAVPALSGAELADRAGIRTEAIDLAAVGGPQLTFGMLQLAAEAARAAEAEGRPGVIITLGTDAMEEAGAFFAYTGPWQINVVLTGAMEPGGEPGSDGPGNLAQAAGVALGAQLVEPVIVFAGQVTLARAVVKVSGLDLDAFASPTERSWSVEEVLDHGALPGARPAPAGLGLPMGTPPEVPIILAALSLGGEPAAPWVEVPPALVCVSGGAGNLTPEATLVAETALGAGAVVAIATRALDRQLSPGYGYPGGSGRLVGAGAVLATGMSPHRLRIFLLVALAAGLRGPALAARLREHVSTLTAGRIGRESNLEAE